MESQRTCRSMKSIQPIHSRHTWVLRKPKFRLFNIFSPRQNPDNPYSGVITKFIERARNNQSPVIFGDGNQTRDFVYIEDVVYAIFKAMENKRATGEVFNIGTGRPTKIKELAEIIINISNKKLKPEFVPEQVGDIRESYADIMKAEEILGYKPKYLLEQGLRLCASYNKTSTI